MIVIIYFLTLHCSQCKCTEEKHGKFGGHFLGDTDDKKKFVSFDSDDDDNSIIKFPIEHVILHQQCHQFLTTVQAAQSGVTKLTKALIYTMTAYLHEEITLQYNTISMPTLSQCNSDDGIDYQLTSYQYWC